MSYLGQKSLIGAEVILGGIKQQVEFKVKKSTAKSGADLKYGVVLFSTRDAFHPTLK